MGEETSVKFNLWAVLVFFFVAGSASFTFLYAEGKETKGKQQEVIQRVVKLEAQYDHIIKGLDKLTELVEKSADKLDQHSKETKSAERVLKWNKIQ
jgi:hypothetical protein